MRLKGVHHIELSALDYEESIKFFDKMFGWLGYKSFWTWISAIDQPITWRAFPSFTAISASSRPGQEASWSMQTMPPAYIMLLSGPGTGRRWTTFIRCFCLKTTLLPGAIAVMSRLLRMPYPKSLVIVIALYAGVTRLCGVTTRRGRYRLKPEGMPPLHTSGVTGKWPSSIDGTAAALLITSRRSYAPRGLWP
jgi:hypothetical protein